MFTEIFSDSQIKNIEETLQYWVSYSGCSVRIDNNSSFAVDVYEGMSKVDRIKPYSYKVLKNSEYELKMNRSVESTSKTDNEFVSVKTLPKQDSEEGSTFFTGTQQIQGDVNVQGDVNIVGNVGIEGDVNVTGNVSVENAIEVYGTVEATIGEATINANIENSTLNTNIENAQLKTNDMVELFELSIAPQTFKPGSGFSYNKALPTSLVGYYDRIAVLLLIDENLNVNIPLTVRLDGGIEGGMADSSKLNENLMYDGEHEKTRYLFGETGTHRLYNVFKNQTGLPISHLKFSIRGNSSNTGEVKPTRNFKLKVFAFKGAATMESPEPIVTMKKDPSISKYSNLQYQEERFDYSKQLISTNLANNKATSTLVDTRDFSKLNLFLMVTGGTTTQLTERDLRLRVYQRVILYTGHSGHDVLVAESEKLGNGLMIFELGDVPVTTNLKKTTTIPMILGQNMYFVVEDLNSKGSTPNIVMNMELKK